MTLQKKTKKMFTIFKIQCAKIYGGFQFCGQWTAFCKHEDSLYQALRVKYDTESTKRFHKQI